MIASFDNWRREGIELAAQVVDEALGVVPWLQAIVILAEALRVREERAE